MANIKNNMKDTKNKTEDKNQRKKILEICNFSSGISGVWTRVFEESKRLAKKNEVYVFSSNLENDKINHKREEILEGIKIKRFPVRSKLGFALFFDFEKEALALRPDIIIVHGYRKPYTNKAIKIAKKINAKIYLVTHAPFVEKNLRSRKLNFIVSLYDKIYGKRILNSFDKIIAIARWEIPYLLKLGAKKEKIVLIPNGIPELFFSKKKDKPKTGKILFFGRIDPIKDIETLIIALSKLSKLMNYELHLTGPSNPVYLNKIMALAKSRNVKLNINLPMYNMSEKISEIDSSDIFILPSKREAMPIALIEAMSREKVVISSDTLGGREMIKEGKTGFLFKKGDSDALVNKISFCLDKRNKTRLERIRKEAKKSVEKYSWDKIIKYIEKTINNK